MVKNLQEYKEPIMWGTLVVISGNGYGRLRSSPCGGLFVFQNLIIYLQTNKIYMIKKKFVETKLGCVVCIIIFIIFIATFSYAIFFSGGNSNTQTSTYTPDEIDLHIQAQQFILQGLKAPSTAKFPALPSSTSTDGKGLYKVISYVDSQNSFGAMIRSDWSVTMRLTNEHWIPEKVFIGNEKVYDATSDN